MEKSGQLDSKLKQCISKVSSLDELESLSAPFKSTSKQSLVAKAKIFKGTNPFYFLPICAQCSKVSPQKSEIVTIDDNFWQFVCAPFKSTSKQSLVAKTKTFLKVQTNFIFCSYLHSALKFPPKKWNYDYWWQFMAIYDFLWLYDNLWLFWQFMTICVPHFNLLQSRVLWQRPKPLKVQTHFIFCPYGHSTLKITSKKVKFVEVAKLNSMFFQIEHSRMKWRKKYKTNLNSHLLLFVLYYLA